jgi:hypothetical protein
MGAETAADGVKTGGKRVKTGRAEAERNATKANGIRLED